LWSQRLVVEFVTAVVVPLVNDGIGLGHGNVYDAAARLAAYPLAGLVVADFVLLSTIALNYDAHVGPLFKWGLAVTGSVRITAQR
jgi:hypothetical protein